MRNSERKLRKNGMGEAIEKGQITINGTREVEVAVYHEAYPDMIDYDATSELVEKVRQVLGWGGYRCAGGFWVLNKDYQGNRAVMLDQLGPAVDAWTHAEV